MLPGAKKDPQIITSSWHKPQPLIEGVAVREILHVPGDRGVLTEIFRAEWVAGDAHVAQVFQIQLFPGALSAWHCHARATDRLFSCQGYLKLVLYDARPASPTHGLVNELHIGQARPTLVLVPPNVWHGVRNLGDAFAVVVNCPSHAYDYDDPDHYRLPSDTAEIPYTW